MSDWRVASLVGLLGALALAAASLQAHRHRFTGSFVIRSLAIWAVIVLVITVFVVYRFEIAEFLAPVTRRMS